MANIFARTLFIWRLQTSEMTSKQIILLPKIRRIARQVFVYIATYCTNVCIIISFSSESLIKAFQIKYNIKM